MKSVSGEIVSTEPVNLFKAANILSNFVTSDNGASQSVCAYLHLSSAAINGLVYFKKHHNRKKPRPKEASTMAKGKCDEGHLRKKLKEGEIDRDEIGDSMRPESKERLRTQAAE